MVCLSKRSAISRSTRSLKIPWYQRAYVKNNQYFNIQKGSIIMGIVAAVSYDLIDYWKFVNFVDFSSSHYSQLELEYLTCIATQWLLLDQHIMDTTLYPTNLFMLATCTLETSS